MPMIFSIGCKLDLFLPFNIFFIISNQGFSHEEKESREVIKNHLAQIMNLFPFSGRCPVLSCANETFFTNDSLLEWQSILQKQQSFTVNI